MPTKRGLQNVVNKTLLTKCGKRKLWEAALCCEGLVSFSETALCGGSLVLQRPFVFLRTALRCVSLVLQRIKDPMSSTN